MTDRELARLIARAVVHPEGFEIIHDPDSKTLLRAEWRGTPRSFGRRLAVALQVSPVLRRELRRFFSESEIKRIVEELTYYEID